AMRTLLTEQGIDPETILGKHVFEVLPDTRDSEIGKAFQKALVERVYVEIESEYPAFGRWYAIRFHPNSDGGVSILSEDITGRKRAEEHLRQGNEERQQLLESERAARMEAERLGRGEEGVMATLSHELRTPIHSILGWVRLLIRDSGNQQLRD